MFVDTNCVKYTRQGVHKYKMVSEMGVKICKTNFPIVILVKEWQQNLALGFSTSLEKNSSIILFP